MGQGDTGGCDRPAISQLLPSAWACTGLSGPVDKPAGFRQSDGDVIRLLRACGLEVIGLLQVPPARCAAARYQGS